MKSAIELYQEAYSLHFKEGKPDLAQELYKNIIEAYPDSDERKYAQFLLSRISSPVEAAPRTSSVSYPIVTAITILLGLVAIAGSIGLFFLFQREQNSSLYFEKILLSMSATQGENFDDALLFLREAKLIDSKRLAGYALSSRIYEKKGRFDLAEEEYRAMLSVQPNNIFAQEQMRLVTKRGKIALEAQTQAAAPKTESAEPSIKPTEAPPLPKVNDRLKEEKTKVLDNSQINYF
jgi:tetratricopeptide (TPR) repeat protein